MIFGYIRVSTLDQTVEGQKNLISRYCTEKKILIDEWIEIEISTRKSFRERRIQELYDKVTQNDTIIVSELSRLGRSVKEILAIIETCVEEKRCRIIIVKQNIDINPKNRSDMTNKVLITIFSMVAELERDFVSERTKEGLLARKAKGIKLGKPKGVIQQSKYDTDKDRIFHLYELGVPINSIINTHLNYGQYQSLKRYIEKRYKKQEAHV
tara:strand:- start:2466 stop:3098 length:633 start_codon:yes stop_codon:yes gene_type:complete